MEKIMSFLLYIYIFFACWTSAYKIGSFLSIPNIILAFLILIYGLIVIKRGKIIKNVYKSEDVLLIIFIFIMTTSFLFNNGNINYIMAYTFIFILGYLFMKSAYFQYIDSRKIFHSNGVAIIFVSFFILIEFLFQYLYQINIRELLLFGDIPTATYLGKYYRSYGFSREPTNLGFYLNALGPLAIWYWLKFKNIKNYKKILIISVIFLGYITTFSAATFVSLLISLFIIFCIYLFNNNIKISKKVFLYIILILTIISLSVVINKSIQNKELNFKYYVEPIIKKLTLTSQLNQEGSRINRWVRDLDSFKEKPILGYGPGMTTIYHGGSSVNWYLNILVENGIIALLIIIAFLIITFYRIYKSKLTNKYYFMTGYLCSIIHFSTLSTFYDPAFWILLIIFHVCNERHKIEELTRVS